MPQSVDPDLQKFHDAQADLYEQALAELIAGKKQTHWIWFVLPQLAGLGRSTRAAYYGIEDLDQAQRYLNDPILGEHLRTCVSAMLSHKSKSAWDILGSPDNWKFKSCLTLFEAAAKDECDLSLFRQALEQFFNDKRDERTLGLLGLGSDRFAELGSSKSNTIGAVKNPTDKQIIDLIKASSERAVRRVVCERSGDVWCWPAENAEHAAGAHLLGATYTRPPGGEILTVDD